MKVLYRNIEAERVRAGLKQDELASILNISTKTYYNYLRGAAIPSQILLKLSKIFNCSIDYLLSVNTNNKSA